MQGTIRKTTENAIIKSKQEVDFTITTDIIENLPWIDCQDVFAKLEERGRAEGMAEGRAEGMAEGRAEGMAEGRAKGRAEGRIEREMEIALKTFSGRNNGRSLSEITSMLKGFRISDEVIKSAREKSVDISLVSGLLRHEAPRNDNLFVIASELAVSFTVGAKQ